MFIRKNIIKRTFLLIQVFFILFSENACCRNGKKLTHIIKRGETLYSISRKYNVSLNSIKKLNHIGKKGVIYPGQKIKIFRRRKKTALRKKKRLPQCCYDWPVKGVITSKYNTKGNIKKNGIKIKAKKGSPIRAVWKGIVVFSGVGPKCMGNMIVLKHKGFFSIYAHNLYNKVKTKQKVGSGEVIGTVGGTGCTKEIGLYFEMRRGKKSLNPLYYLSKKRHR